MPQEISFENFKYTEKDYYYKIRDGNDDISFSYLSNYVYADMDNRIMTIDVDDHFIKMHEIIDSRKKSKKWKHRFVPHSGEIITNPIGEQMIAFCETDFKELMKLPLALKMLSGETQADKNEDDIKEPITRVMKPTTDEELDLIYYENYEVITGLAEDVIKANLYVNLFPPLIYKRSKKMLNIYFSYILALQKEYQKLLDFCFNTDFYPEDLNGITAASRFRLYRETTDMVPIQTIDTAFRLARKGIGEYVLPLRDREAYDKLVKDVEKAISSIKKRKPNVFEREYGIDPRSVDILRMFPVPILSSYKCRSLEDILFLEFEKMLELDMRIRKCKNCGHYFIFKGNYQTEYCDRIPKGETQNCQSLSAITKYTQKVKENPALAIFNRAYKRYHARVKVGTVKPDDFRKWKYEAVVMRGKCLDGEISIEEFEAWIDADKNK